MKRTFIAVNIEANEKLRDLVSTLNGELNGDTIKWLDTNHLHITLAFLGDTGDETVKQVISMLERSCKGYGEFDFNITGLGVFRNTSDARIVWAGIKSADRLEKLCDKIKQGLESIGVRIEERQFKPHLTIGRVKRLKNKNILERLIGQFDKTTFQEVSVSEVIFYESILKPSGPLHLPLYAAALK